MTAPAWLIRPAFAAPAVVPEIPAAAVPLRLHDGELELVGIEAGRRVQPGGELAVTFYWQLSERTTDEYVTLPRLLDSRLEAVAGTNAFPGWGNWPLSFGQPGAIYADSYRLPAAADAQRPGLGRVILSIEADHIVQPPVAHDGTVLDALWPLAWVALPACRAPVAVAGAPLAVFDDSVALVAVRYPEAASRGETLVVELDWQARQPSGADWHRFVHLDDGNQAQPRLVAQADGVPANGYGLPWWEPGEIVPDRVVLGLLRGVPAGMYSLWVGLYDLAGARAAISGGDHQDGRLYLGSVVVR